METAVAAAAVLIPLVLGLVQLSKPLASRSWYPLLALVYGIVAAVLVAWSDEVAALSLDRPGYVVLVGLLAGLGSSGAYSQIKTFAESS